MIKKIIMFYKHYFIFVIFCALLVSGNVQKRKIKEIPEEKEVRKFPDGFKFGGATASYQIEGAWNEDGKSESIWDTMTHLEPSPIVDGSTGDVADDSYHQYKRDVEMMRELGLDFYRFSLSWPRILPNSFSDQTNEAGVQYYNNLIDEMLKYNIQPMVTLYHWDLPQKLQDLGGWTNPYIVDWFGDYARVAFDLFGDRVKTWITMNEPLLVCQGYGSDSLAPRLNISGVADYMCAKNLILAHARAWHIYDEEYRSIQDGNIGITYNSQYFEPEAEEHSDIAEDFLQFNLGIYANPIHGTGDYPTVVKEKIAAKSFTQGYSRSRLPELSNEEIDYIKGTSDFFGLNHYSSSIVYKNETVSVYHTVPSFNDDIGGISYQPSTWDTPNSSRIKVVPWGFYKLLTWIREEYNNPVIYITENGYDTSGGTDDDERVNYYRTYLDAMLDAIEEGSNIVAYTAWSLMDNFDWSKGYTQRFGIYEVDYESPERTRTPRKSAFVYKEIIRSRSLDFEYEAEDITKMTIDDGH